MGLKSFYFYIFLNFYHSNTLNIHQTQNLLIKHQSKNLKLTALF
ncbi:hypothetical protein HFN_2230 [Helicobacter fennelliae MRY12-0050]|uniref:Uncharacterized protein n=1 Tax=Helicobacter fennelliae MRY12-0050 TaxID=1325130 RepID=T1DVK3_9HELI|nr:hypothetical protein HFN_2230 [Helicobacter fennelliae MRY12-0050]